MRLNVRAILESLRRGGIRVANTSAADMDGVAVLDTEKRGQDGGQDFEILDTDGRVRGWVAVDLDEGKEGKGEKGEHKEEKGRIEADGPMEAVVEGEVKA